MFPACAFKHSPDVLLEALLGPALDGVALAALDKVHVVTEDAEPEGQIRIGDSYSGSAVAWPMGTTRRT